MGESTKEIVVNESVQEVAINENTIKNLIYVIRGWQVMLDSDLAELYQVETKVFNQAVKRNIERFPKEFCFQLTREEYNSLRSQIVTSKGKGGRRYLPYVFTEQGIAGLIRSMFKKGCSPDNSACEGFSGHLKTEMFYGCNWAQYSIDEFIQEVNEYTHWYCKDRIKSTLGGLSPLDYRRSMGVAV